MSRCPTTFFRTLLTASLAAIALTGCGGGGNDAPAPPPVAAAAPAEEPRPAPPAASLPAPTPPVVAPPVASADTAPASEPPRSSTPTAAPTAKPQQQQPDALQWMRDSEARKADYQRRLAEGQVNVENATQSVLTWERNVLAFKNPFLARPQLSPEDAQEVAGMNGAARVVWAEGRMAAAVAARVAAQKTLDELKANPPLD